MPKIGADEREIIVKAASDCMKDEEWFGGRKRQDGKKHEAGKRYPELFSFLNLQKKQTLICWIKNKYDTKQSLWFVLNGWVLIPFLFGATPGHEIL